MRRFLLAAGLLAVAVLLSVFAWHHKQRAQHDWMVAWTKSLILARTDAQGATEISADAVEPRATENSWTVNGKVAVGDAAGQSGRQPYAAVVERVCSAYTERRCWQLRSLEIGDRAVAVDGDVESWSFGSAALSSLSPPAAAAPLPVTPPAPPPAPAAALPASTPQLASAPSLATAAADPEPAPARAAATDPPANPEAEPAPDPVETPEAGEAEARPDAAPIETAAGPVARPARPAPDPAGSVPVETREAAGAPPEQPASTPAEPAAEAPAAAAADAPKTAPARFAAYRPPLGNADGASQRYRSLVFLIQSRLTMLGYAAGRMDGEMSEETHAAIAAYQRAYGLPPDGQPSNRLLDHIERELLGRRRGREAPPAAAARPTIPEGYALFHKGYEAAERRAFDLAIDYYTRALKSGDLSRDDHVYALNNRGNAYSDKGLYELAIRDYDQALRLNPAYAVAYNNRCSNYHHMGQYDRAIADCTKAIRLDPDYAAAYNNRGSAYHGKGLYALAIKDYNTAIRLEPTEDYAYFNRGGIYEYQGDLERAVADFKKAYALNPDNPGYQAKIKTLGLTD